MTAREDSMDLICPMHAILDTDGIIRHAGPTLQKLRPDTGMVGRRILEMFEVTRPQGIDCAAGLMAMRGRTLHLRFRDAPHTAFKAVSVPDPSGTGLLINLSFGISIVEAVQDYALTHADFAATDLTIELLYLVEAKSAAMDASRRLNQRLRGARDIAEEQAVTDALTGLTNRRGLEVMMKRLIARNGRFALMQVDLDFFKQVNDRLGHDVGDQVLRRVGQIMREETRDRDVVARVGGDEFVLIIDSPVSVVAVEQIGARLISRLREPMAFDRETSRISCSIGSVFSSDYDAPEIAQLFKDADIALYASKNAGRGRHVFHHQLKPAGTGVHVKDPTNV
ncbi:GGDEF domain-containing protein [Aestuariivita sp.]|uniref:GGDEF domain-containing protein n=1 Tax=Aestuariivita sp. TaxID=1872407 RepID=UPI00341F17E8